MEKLNENILIPLHILIQFLVTGVNMQLSELCVTPINNCACKTETGYINLEPLDSASKTGTPKFNNIKDVSSRAVFFYNPCSAFTVGSCINVAVCGSVAPSYIDIGIQDSAHFISNPLGTAAVLEYNSMDNHFTTDILLNCEPTIEGDLIVKSSSESGLFTLDLRTKYACPDIAPPPGGSQQKKNCDITVSPGDVILITFFVTMTLYFAVGITFNKYHKGARGIEILPNVDFWKSLPGLAKDGVKFTWSKISKKQATQGYTEI